MVLKSEKKIRLLILTSGGSQLISDLTEKLAQRTSTLRTLHSFSAAIALIRTERFDCIAIERTFAEGDGIFLAPIAKRLSPTCTLLLLGEEAPWATLEGALYLGFDEVIHKGSSLDEMLLQIEAAISLKPLLNEINVSSESKIHLLSLREREILLDIATGATTVEIAQKRNNSVATIKSHLSSIYRKLEVRNRVEAISKIQ